MDDNINSDKVFHYFREISKIPRKSGNEKGISDYIVEFAKQRRLEVIQDELYNVIIKKEASKGCEKSKPLMLQSHIDMVCEKTSQSSHDFENEGLDLYTEGDFLRARETSLGADNGIGVAFILAVLDNNDIACPKIEAIFTVMEEVNMAGIKNIDIKKLESKQIIGFDFFKEGGLLVSTAGIMKINIKREYNIEELSNNYVPFLIQIGGLCGGHSGSQIHLNRGNSNCLMGTVLNDLLVNINFKLHSINGGTVDNAIPRETSTIIFINKNDEYKLNEICNKWNKTFKETFLNSDKDVFVKHEKAIIESERIIDDKCKNDLIAFLVKCPNGVRKMSEELKGVVETSTNIGVIKTQEKQIIIEMSIRSNVEQEKEKTFKIIETIAQSLECRVKIGTNYSGLKYKEKSNLRDICIEVYKEIYGKFPIISAEHFGVELGLLDSKIEGLDGILFGSNAYDYHSPNERVSISSTKRTWGYLVRVLEKLSMKR